MLIFSFLASHAVGSVRRRVDVSNEEALEQSKPDMVPVSLSSIMLMRSHYQYITTTKDLTTRTSTRTPVLDIEEVEDFEVQDPSGETLEGSVERYGKPVDAIHDMNQDLGDWED